MQVEGKVVVVTGGASGIGKALVEAAEARLAERGCTRIEVTSSLERSGALAFYQASGFERSGFLLTNRL